MITALWAEAALARSEARVLFSEGSESQAARPITPACWERPILGRKPLGIFDTPKEGQHLAGFVVDAAMSRENHNVFGQCRFCHHSVFLHLREAHGLASWTDCTNCPFEGISAGRTPSCGYGTDWPIPKTRASPTGSTLGFDFERRSESRYGHSVRARMQFAGWGLLRGRVDE